MTPWVSRARRGENSDNPPRGCPLRGIPEANPRRSRGTLGRENLSRDVDGQSGFAITAEGRADRPWLEFPAHLDDLRRLAVAGGGRVHPARATGADARRPGALPVPGAAGAYCRGARRLGTGPAGDSAEPRHPPLCHRRIHQSGPSRLALSALAEPSALE